ncbi:Stonustoxin subunit alpha [Madurella mycetomatis]|uniref:Stonustoxin subunit alpha n=1 Tax=Madurella mycetomatis TaxID=100816 RepID=A0A175W469_9PEZI|nr:Stonustoxin subunit alpha [Madurella mycetomatis]
MSMTIKRPSLGQIAGLGDFYDAVTDSFSSISLLKAAAPPMAVRRTDNPGTEMNFTKEDTFEERFRGLRVGAELGASILSNLMSVDGIGRFLTETRSSARTRQLSCLYRVTTVHEKLNLSAFMMAPDLQELLDLGALRGRVGTHVVAEIEWGAFSVVTARYEVENSNNQTDVQAKLDAGLGELSKIVGVGANAGAELGVKRGKGLTKTAFNIKVYGDFVSDMDMPADFKSAQNYIRSMPSAISTSNGGKGKPLVYTLIPVEILHMLYDITVESHVALKRLGHDVLEQFVQLFDDWTVVRQKLNDYRHDAMKHQFCLPAGHLAEVSDHLHQARAGEARLKEAYAKILTDVRRGKSEPNCLWSLLKESQSESSSPERLMSIVQKHQERIKFADAMVNKGARFVGHDIKALNNLIMEQGRNDTYVLYFNDAVQVAQPTRWDDNRRLIVELLESKSGDLVIICDCDLGNNPISMPYVEQYRAGKLIVKDVSEVRRFLDGYCVIRYERAALNHPENGLPAQRRMPLTMQEINVLILGETGVGKSTFINAFVNYLTYDSLKEAIKAGKPQYVVPYSFSLPYPDGNGGFHPLDIQVGSSPDEKHGKTAVHRIPLNDTTVLRLIDTPGIGDTRGIQQDALNKEDILATLRHIDKLHGILILLKPTNSRLDVMFRFCITELLTHLHQDAASNFCFGFTNTRGSFYTPGDTYVPLKALLGKYNNSKISLSTHTTYCFDSESFRFLAALSETKTQMPGLDDFERSWERSVKESKRLLAHWAILRGHRVKSTLSLNTARDLILAIREPLSRLEQLMTETIKENERDAEALQRAEITWKELESRLFINTIVLKHHILDKPRTVCTNAGCRTRKVDDKGLSFYEYNIICHDMCRMPPGIEHLGEPSRWLLACGVFSHGLRTTCSTCNHSWKLHIHVKDEYRTKVQRSIDPGVRRLMDENGSKAQIQARHLEALEKQIKSCELERFKLMDASTAFGRYLKRNSIAPYNDEALAYMDAELMALSNLSGDTSTMSSRSDSISSLANAREEYAKGVETIQKYIKSPDATIPTDEEVYEILERLYDLERCGPTLRNIVLKKLQSGDSYVERAFHGHLDNGRTLSSGWDILDQEEAYDAEFRI